MVWVAEARGEDPERNPHVDGIDAKARQRPARSQHLETRFEGRPRSERLDRDIDTAAIGELPDLINGIDFADIDSLIGTKAPGDSEPVRQPIDGGNGGRAQ